MKREWINGGIASRATSLLDTSIQMSNYRDKLLAVLPIGYGIRAMAVQVISRDSGLLISAMRHIEEKAPLIPVHGVSKRWVDRYLGRKKDILLDAIDKDHAPLCRLRERWFGKKCGSYCEVSEQCRGTSGWDTDPLLMSLLLTAACDETTGEAVQTQESPSPV